MIQSWVEGRAFLIGFQMCTKELLLVLIGPQALEVRFPTHLFIRMVPLSLLLYVGVPCKSSFEETC